MKPYRARIISNRKFLRRPDPQYCLTVLEAPEVASTAKPGQFVMVSCGNHLLRRPFSIHRSDKNGNLAILFSIIPGANTGTGFLSRLKKGDVLDIIGPLGNGFSILPQSRSLLMLAGRIGVAPLVFLAHSALKQGLSVTMIQGGAKGILLNPFLKLLSKRVEYIPVTEDGSLLSGKTTTKTGKITDIIAPFVPQYDQIFACGPIGMYCGIKTILEEMQYKNSVQVSFDIRMGCGLGACYGCSVHTKHGMKKVCQNGPIFELSDFTFEDLQKIKIWP